MPGWRGCPRCAGGSGGRAPGRAGRFGWTMPPFDIAHHVHAVHLAAADTDRFLSWAATWAACRLDRNRPLWRMAFVSGLASGEVGVVVVVHHAMADGAAGAALAVALLDSGPAQPRLPTSRQPAPSPRPHELIRAAAVDRLAQLRRLVSRMSHRRTHRSDLRETFTALRSRAPDIGLPSPPAEARTTASASWPLETVRAAGHAHTATVNDVMLAAVATGMRRLLTEQGRPTRGLVLRVSVPVAGARGSRNAGGTTPLVVPLPADVTDPVRLLRGVSAGTRLAKVARDRAYPGVFAAPLMPLTLVRLGIRWMTRHSAALINLYVTNVPGPHRELWFAGARLRAAYPLPPLIAGVPLAVGVLSYAGSLTLTVTAAPGVAVDAVTAEARTTLRALLAAPPRVRP
jgi:diacylglycerol O-acyltransferase